MRNVRLALVALLIPTGAAAAGLDQRAVGAFESKRGGYEQDVEVKADGTGGYTGAFSTATNTGCGGGVTMQGRASGPAAILFSKTENGKTCRITARYAPDFQSVALTEEGCTFHHGAACEFEGKLKRTRR